MGAAALKLLFTGEIEQRVTQPNGDQGYAAASSGMGGR